MPDEFGHLPGLEMSKEQYQKDLKLGQEFAQSRDDQARKKTESYSLMQDIIDEVLGTYKSINDANATVIKEGFQKALAELHKSSF